MSGHGDPPSSSPDERFARLAAQLSSAEPRHEGSEMRRREWLELCGASLALAGVTGCARAPRERIMPYVRHPAGVTPGIPQQYATSATLDGYAVGLVVQSHTGRPTKVEGNPAHPASLGATGAFEQALVLGLYDPARARSIRRGRSVASWERLASALREDRADRGAGLRLLLEPSTSPLMASALARLGKRFPEARVTYHCASRGRAARDGAALAFGAPLEVVCDLGEASTILALDADFLGQGPFRLRYARQFADRRRVPRPGDAMNRLYVVETATTITGTMADHRLAIRSAQVARLAAAIAAELVHGSGRRLPGMSDELVALLARLRGTAHPELVRAIAKDLVAAKDRAAILVGDRQPPDVHAIGHFIQALCGAGRTSGLVEPALLEDAPSEARSIMPPHDLAALAEELRRGAVDTLIVLEGNPSYTSPVDLELGRLLRGVRTSVYLGLYEDETARDATWFVPALHPLEQWGDARALDGTLSTIQPLIAPLYDGRAPVELVAALAGDAYPSAYRLLLDAWGGPAPVPEGGGIPATAEALPGPELARVLEYGLAEGSAFSRSRASLVTAGIAGALRRVLAAPTAHEGLELSFVPDPSVHDGRFSSNAWLQELPRPITKLTWDNAAQLSPATAARLGLASEDRVRLTVGGRSLNAAALVVPGQADDTVVLALGYGKTAGPPLAVGLGFDAFTLRTSASPEFVAGLTLERLPGTYPLARTQDHFRMEGQPIALSVTADDYAKHPDFTAGLKGAPVSILPLVTAPGSPAENQWAMTIDLGACTGCGACVMACQAENNTLVVGKEGVLRGREMHWLRIDTYFTGDLSAPGFVNQPMACQHCEKAPCEYVCPVNATVHSPDGLNEMTYNRCVGTRFCSNNCPYKVRRFNFFDYLEEVPANQGLVELGRNPEVTVRERGVMEKCTYCVQRIRGAERAARVAGAPISSVEVTTACQQACPTQAIVFGSVLRPDAEVVARRAEPRSYDVLHELGTRPRTRYLARIENKKPGVG